MEDILKSNTQTPSDSNSNGDINTNDIDIQEDVNNPEDLDSMWLRWKCLNCGYLYEGVTELKKCPKCGNENPDLFTDVE